VESYEAFVALFTQGPLALEARGWLDLHRRMVAWNEAVIVNTAASHRGFLAEYPQTDLTVTAYRLIERLNNRPIIAPVVAAAAGGSPSSPATPINTPQASTPSQPTNVALGPTCPCSAPALPIRRIDTPPTKKRESDPPKRASSQPPRGRQVVDEDVVVYRRPPPPPRDYYEAAPPPPPPPVGIGIGIGIGGGGFGGGHMSGGGGYPSRYRGGY